TKVVPDAPRLSASSPTTPVPAKRSKNGRPGTALPRMLNSASRTICGVGRRVGGTMQVSLRPRMEPATIRICVRMFDDPERGDLCSKADPRAAGKGAAGDSPVGEPPPPRVRRGPALLRFFSAPLPWGSPVPVPFHPVGEDAFRIVIGGEGT